MPTPYRGPADLFVGLDVGTSGARALAIDGTGRVVAEASASYPLASPRPGWAEQDPEDWFRAACRALAAVAEQTVSTGATVRGLGLTGQMHSAVFLDASDRSLRPAILWCDQRAVVECDEIVERAGGLASLLAMTANRALAGFTAPKILWVRRHEPELFSRVRSVLVAKDYVRFRLTGEKMSEVTDASGTLLFDVRRRRIDESLLDRLEIDRSMLADVVESGEITGRVRDDVARLCGLPPATPVVGGAGDQAAAAVGCGVIREGMASLSLGTSGVIFAPTAQPLEDPTGGLHVFCHAAPDLWHAMGVTLSAGGSIRWWRDLLAEGPGAEPGQLAFRELDREAATVEAGAQGLLFLPYLCGERTPIHDPRARGVFMGVSLAHRQAHLSRAVLEGVGYALRSNLELLGSRGVRPAEIRVTGGGARSPFLRGLLAEMLETPLVRLEVDEGPALGAAILAALGVGAYSDLADACAGVVRTTDRLEPTGADRETYRKGLVRFEALYHRLAPLWQIPE